MEVDERGEAVVRKLSDAHALPQPAAVAAGSPRVGDEFLALHHERRPVLEHLDRDIARRGRVQEGRLAVAVRAGALAAPLEEVVVEHAPLGVDAVRAHPHREAGERLDAVRQDRRQGFEHRRAAVPPGLRPLVHRGGVPAVEDRPLGHRDVQRPEAPGVRGDLGRQDRLEHIGRVRGGVVVGAVDAAPG